MWDDVEVSVQSMKRAKPLSTSQKNRLNLADATTVANIFMVGTKHFSVR